MEFRDVVRRRRMIRTYTDEPVPALLVDEILDVARRAPSAGFTQGTSFVVLEGLEQTAPFWTLTDRSPESTRTPRWDRLRTAPVVVLVLVSGQAYLDRYAEADKTGAQIDRQWPTIDGAFAVMSMLLAATDAGLGALFFSVPTAHGVRGAPLRAALGIPEEYGVAGAVALGWPAPDDPPSSSLKRGRRPRPDVVHYGRWGGTRQG